MKFEIGDIVSLTRASGILTTDDVFRVHGPSSEGYVCVIDINLNTAAMDFVRDSGVAWNLREDTLELNRVHYSPVIRALRDEK